MSLIDQDIQISHIDNSNHDELNVQFIVINEDGKYDKRGNAITVTSKVFFNEDVFHALIVNNTDFEKYYLVLDNYFIDSMSLIITSNSGGQVSLILPTKNTDNQSSIGFELVQGDTAQIRLSVFNRPPYSIPVFISEADHFITVHAKQNLMTGIYFGSFFLFLTFTIGIWVILKGRKYLYYSLYILFSSLFYLMENGHWNYLSGEVSSFSEKLIFSVILLSLISLILFSNIILTVHRRFQYLDVIGKGILAFAILILLAVWSPLLGVDALFPFIYNGLLTCFLIGYIYCLVRAFAFQSRSTWINALLAFGYAMLLIGIISKPICFLGFIDYGFWPKYGAMIGQYIELCSLSLFLLVLNYSDLREKHELEQQIETYRKTALQAQMNPHFIFNCLNSIQNFIMLNDRDNAMGYLAKFARLIRENLNASVETEISVHQEIEILETYLSLEQLRFKDKFSFAIEVDKNVDVISTKIAPLLIQPLVENAIIHGMKGVEKDGVIRIKFRSIKDGLEVSVFDNGLFVKPSESRGDHKSLGMSITSKRLGLINGQDYKDLDINPIINEMGTTVTIFIRAEKLN